MNAIAQRRPLRAGTEIDYCGMSAIVVADFGGERVTVNCEGHVQNWMWRFEDAECVVVKEPQGELSYDSFDAYVRDFPAAERTRRWLTNEGRCPVWLFRLVDPPHSGSPHGGLAGNYMAVSLHANAEYLRLAAHDCDDGLMVRDFAPGEKQAALQVLEDMKQLAPFSMWDAAKVFQFRWE